MTAPSAVAVDNWLDIRADARTRKGADVDQVSLRSADDPTAPEPKGKLDAMTVPFVAYAAAVRIVNGPEGDVLAVDWYSRTAYGGHGRGSSRRRGISFSPTSPWSLLEPDAVKVARPVLRGPRHGNVPGLPAYVRSPGDRCAVRRLGCMVGGQRGCVICRPGIGR